MSYIIDHDITCEKWMDVYPDGGTVKPAKTSGVEARIK